MCKFSFIIFFTWFVLVRWVRVVTCSSDTLIFIIVRNSIVWTKHNFFIHCFVSGLLGYSPHTHTLFFFLTTITNIAAMNILEHKSTFLKDVFLRVELPSLRKRVSSTWQDSAKHLSEVMPQFTLTPIVWAPIAAYVPLWPLAFSGKRDLPWSKWSLRTFH